MAKETIDTALKKFDERYYKTAERDDDYALFCNNFPIYIKKIDSAVKNRESEEHLKNIANNFLKDIFYPQPKYEINAYKRVDSAVISNGILYAIMEMKKPSNPEMVRENDLNRKAFWEIVYYYLCETRDVTGKKVRYNHKSEIRRLIISDTKKWFLFDAQDLDKVCQGDIEKLFFKFENKQLPYNDTDTFYAALKSSFDEINITQKLDYVFFDLDKIVDRKNRWKYIFKTFKKDFLIKDGYKPLNKTHILNKNFYKELLYLMGLSEEKVEGKNVIKIDRSIQHTLADQVYSILAEEKEFPEERATEETFELVLIWINRFLFIKLFEGQLLSFNQGKAEYRILDNEKITSFSDVQSLFFDVLGRKDRGESPFLLQFSNVPYLNSSLFERYDVEKNDVNIREIRNVKIAKRKGSILGRKAPDHIPLLEYLIDFLNSYSFAAVTGNINGKSAPATEIIDASVLGLIFEKINGYKEGSFYTKGFVTEYICQETIEAAVVDKLNKEFKWHCQNIDDVKTSIDYNSAAQIKRINELINTLHICDPAVGSGHFLVSALNRIIAIKKELGVLLKCDSNSPLREYNITVIDDVLCVFDGQGNEFQYNPTDYMSQIIQKTLFNEKKVIIENCLFGVDINPNAVAICQLRLWIELLKNAYYENGIMETLPNIDINIKCGDSLVHKLRFEGGQKLGLKDVGLDKSNLQDLKQYKDAVARYHAESDKKAKTNLKAAINAIKDGLYAACSQMMMYDTGDGGVEIKEDSKWSAAFLDHAFEWGIEFPQVLSDDGVYLGFDCVIGNPPYIRVQDLNHEAVDYYKEKYETAWKRIDISTLFIELGYQLIPQDGYVSFITSNQFTSTEYGRRMRTFLCQHKFINRVIEFADLPVFDGVLTYVSIFLFKKNARNRGFDYYKVPKLPFVQPTQNQFFRIEYDGLSEEPWLLKSNEVRNCLEKIRKASSMKLRNYAKCWAGAFTGKDEILMFPAQEAVPFEEEMSISVIRADSCARYEYATPSRKIYYPYVEQNGDTVLIPLSELEKKYPETYSYIMQHENELKERKDSRVNLGDRIGWYGLVRFGQLSKFKKKKIVSPGEVKNNKFSLDVTGSAFSCGRVFSITAEDENVSIEYLLAFLNTKLCEFYLHNTAAVKAGGYYSYSSTSIDDIPFIYSEEKAPIVENLVNEILERKTNHFTTIDLETQVDDIFNELYGISDADKKVISSFLDAPNDE